MRSTGSAEHRTDDHTENQRRVDLPVHLIQIFCPVALGHDHSCSAAKPHEQPHQQVDKGAGSTHSCQRVGPHKVAYDQGVGGVVQLLKQSAEPNGQKENQQLTGNAAGQDIRLFDSMHDERCFSPLLYSLRTYFML